MTAYNVVRMRVKPGKEQEFLDRHRDFKRAEHKGSRKFAIIKTGERSYCVIGEWESMEAIVASRPTMIARLDTFRDLLEDLGGSLGVTDPVAGTALIEL